MPFSPKQSPQLKIVLILYSPSDLDRTQRVLNSRGNLQTPPRYLQDFLLSSLHQGIPDTFRRLRQEISTLKTTRSQQLCLFHSVIWEASLHSSAGLFPQRGSPRLLQLPLKGLRLGFGHSVAPSQLWFPDPLVSSGRCLCNHAYWWGGCRRLLESCEDRWRKKSET